MCSKSWLIDINAACTTAAHDAKFCTSVWLLQQIFRNRREEFKMANLDDLYGEMTGKP
jgi:hypothetical protein